MSKLISFGQRLATLASQTPDKAAIVFVPRTGPEHIVTWRELHRRSFQVASLLAERGVQEKSMVIVGLPNCPEHYMTCFATWRLGACVLPLSFRMPPAERDAILDLARPSAVVAEWERVAYPVIPPADLEASRGLPVAPLPDRIPHPGWARASGGSTGRPKTIVSPAPWARVPGEYSRENAPISGFRSGQVQLVAGPLYHGAPFGWSHEGLFEEHTLVLMEKFDPARAVDLIERHRVQWAFFVPTMMQRIVQLPDIRQRDLSSLEAIFHAAASCSAWLKRGWIELLGGEKVYEAYGATESVGLTAIRGDEWLQHPGSVGRPHKTVLRIMDEAGRELPVGRVGEIFMRPEDTSEPTYEYVGSEPAKTTSDGLVSVGDLGWVDSDGYLYLADRRRDMIVSGGANVYPAEVEAALTEHGEVIDVVVVGLSDEVWGKRVHAIVQPRDPVRPPSPHELDAHCRLRLTAYKVPKSYEFVATLQRDPSGKMRRSALAAERERGEIERVGRSPE